MIRISALNDVEGDEEDEKDVGVSAESQEMREREIIKLYNEALSHQSRSNLDEAIAIYNRLLETQFLLKAEPAKNSQEPSPNGVSPIYGKTDLTIKYSCLRNLAEIHRGRKHLNTALKFYVDALNIDGTDVSMWYRAGIIASKLGHIHFAPEAFLSGVKCSPQNISCLDRAAVSLVVEGDYPLAMELVSSCFKIQANYPRGMALRDIMLETQPYLKTAMSTISPGADLYFDVPYNGPEEVKEKLRKEIETLEGNFALWLKREREKPIEYVEFLKPLEGLTWHCLGESIAQLAVWFDENNESFYQRHVTLLSSLPVPKSETKQENDVAPDSQEPMQTVEAEVQKEAVEAEGKDAESEEPKMRKRAGTGTGLMEQLFRSDKRRSTRVRTSRKEQESMSVAEALTNILPRHFLHKIKVPTRGVSEADEGSMDTMDLYKLFEKQYIPEEAGVVKTEGEEEDEDHDKMAAKEGFFGTLQEESDVKVFLETHEKKPFVDIMRGYVFAMEKMWTKTWPRKLTGVYIDCYKAWRKQNGISPQYMYEPEVIKRTHEECGITLLFYELMVDIDECDEKKIPLSLMHNFVSLINFPEAFPDVPSHALYKLRMMWVRAHLFLSRGETSSAISFLHASLDCYEDHPELEKDAVRLKNCKRNNRITKEIVQAALDAQSRRKSLSEMVRLYNEGSYKEVAETLRDHLTLNGGSAPVRFEDEVLTRKGQINMLINTLYHLDEYKECVYWLETSCYELLNKSSRREGETESQEWKVEFDQILVAMEECCEWGDFKLYDALPKNRLPRFVQTLCHAICRQLEDYERPPCASRPWMTLNGILVSMEEQEPAEEKPHRREDEGAESDDDSDVSDIPPSVLVLFTAHEYLGRREWCNCDGNVLLFLVLDQVIPRLRSPDWAAFRDTVQQYLDQVVYCLYAHPSKKTKSRSVVDHNVTPIPLTWDRAIQLFQLYRPDETPSFDSLRINLISADTEVLLRRIASLVPDDIDPQQSTDVVSDFIYKRREDPPTPRSWLPADIADIFYVLGDYYFKTHESGKAVNYLLMDLSSNSHRVDAWASMALSKVSQLEFTLNSCDPIQNDEFLKEAMAAVRCYERCMSLDANICTLWIEYGSFAYTVHSFCSQRMKLESESLSMDQFEEIESTKTKMLEAAKEAFANANNIWHKSSDESQQDERWLHYYMLGKISEKAGDLSCLDHYKKANQLLYDNNALFPKKISYNTPQHLAIESMEIYYRAHVCVIKTLELQNGEPLDEKIRQQFSEFIDFFAKGPFACRSSKADLLKQKVKAAEAAELMKKRDNEAMHKIIDDIISNIVMKSDEMEREVKQVLEEVLVTVQKNVELKCRRSMDGIDTVDGKGDGERVEKPEEPMRRTSSDEIVKQEEITAVSEGPKFSPESSDAVAETKSEFLEEIKEKSAEENVEAEKNYSNLASEKKPDASSEVLNFEEVTKNEDALDGAKTDVKTEKGPTVDQAGEEMEVHHQEDKNLEPQAADCGKKPEPDVIDIASSDDELSDVKDFPVVVPQEVVDPNKPVICTMFAPPGLPPNTPLAYPPGVFEPYVHEQQLPEDNYYYTLDDLKAQNPTAMQEKKPKQVAKKLSGCKKRRKMDNVEMSSGSDSEEDIAYADDTDSGHESSSSTSSSSRSSSSSSERRKKRKRSKGHRPNRPPTETPNLVAPEPELAKEEGEIDVAGEIEDGEITPSPPVAQPIPLDPEEALLQHCLSAFALCAVRFPQHYKSVYRLAHFFYRSKKHRDLEKCKELLLGTYVSPHGNINGLFSERKNTNFFNGIWRLPAGDVDRPGSFASHMSRSVMLLLEVLRDLRDHKLLLELCLQLIKVPEPDKRYLREDERLPLSKQALTLSLQSLRHTVRYEGVMTLPIVLDAYRIYRRVQKHYPSKENAFGDCLRDAFNRLGKGKSSLEQCLKFCQAELTGNKMAFPSPPPSAMKQMKKRKKDENKVQRPSRPSVISAPLSTKSVPNVADSEGEQAVQSETDSLAKTNAAETSSAEDNKSVLPKSDEKDSALASSEIDFSEDMDVAKEVKSVASKEDPDNCLMSDLASATAQKDEKKAVASESSSKMEIESIKSTQEVTAEKIHKATKRKSIDSVSQLETKKRAIELPTVDLSSTLSKVAKESVAFSDVKPGKIESASGSTEKVKGSLNNGSSQSGPESGGDSKPKLLLSTSGGAEKEAFKPKSDVKEVQQPEKPDIFLPLKSWDDWKAKDSSTLEKASVIKPIEKAVKRPDKLDIAKTSGAIKSWEDWKAKGPRETEKASLKQKPVEKGAQRPAKSVVPTPTGSLKGLDGWKDPSKAWSALQTFGMAYPGLSTSMPQQSLFGFPSFGAESYASQFASFMSQLPRMPSSLIENPVNQRKRMEKEPPAAHSGTSKPSKGRTDSSKLTSKNQPPAARPPPPPAKPSPPKPMGSSYNPFKPTAMDDAMKLVRAQKNLAEKLSSKPEKSPNLQSNPTSAKTVPTFSAKPTPTSRLPPNVSSTPEPKSKFNIADILKKNPGTSITQKPRVTNEAVNLCANKTETSSSGKRNDDDSKRPESPEIVCID